MDNFYYIFADEITKYFLPQHKLVLPMINKQFHSLLSPFIPQIKSIKQKEKVHKELLLLLNHGYLPPVVEENPNNYHLSCFKMKIIEQFDDISAHITYQNKDGEYAYTTGMEYANFHSWPNHWWLYTKI